MLHVDDKQETLHIYVVREEAPKPRLFPYMLISNQALSTQGRSKKPCSSN
jgi:hypothetical protein